MGIHHYVIHERHLLDGEGTHVTVQAAEHFGRSHHPCAAFASLADIHGIGLGSAHHMPLLGAADGDISGSH
jgi:hypothetical protein